MVCTQVIKLSFSDECVTYCIMFIFRAYYYKRNIIYKKCENNY